jgi:hypothetical protein
VRSGCGFHAVPSPERRGVTLRLFVVPPMARARRGETHEDAFLAQSALSVATCVQPVRPAARPLHASERARRGLSRNRGDRTGERTGGGRLVVATPPTDGCGISAGTAPCVPPRNFQAAPVDLTGFGGLGHAVKLAREFRQRGPDEGVARFVRESQASRSALPIFSSRIHAGPLFSSRKPFRGAAKLGAQGTNWVLFGDSFVSMMQVAPL